MSGKVPFEAETRTLNRLRSRIEQLDQSDEAARVALYREIRWIVRELMLKNRLFPTQPVVFVKHRRFVDQMLHEYVGYYYNYGDLAGGGIYALEEPGRSLKTKNLVPAGLPRGTCTTPAVSFDGKTVYFAFSEVRDEPRNYAGGAYWLKLIRASRVPEPFNYNSPQKPFFHLYSIAADGRGLRRLSDGADDDFSPCPLPDGRLVFLSTRRGGFCRCDGDVEPVPTYTLHRMDGDGRNIRTLSFHETNEWHPSVLNDGRIVLFAMGLRRPFRGPFSWALDHESRWHEPAAIGWQLHQAGQRLLSAPGRPRLESNPLRCRGTSRGRRRLAGSFRPEARETQSGKRRGRL